MYLIGQGLKHALDQINRRLGRQVAYMQQVYVERKRSPVDGTDLKADVKVAVRAIDVYLQHCDNAPKHSLTGLITME